MMVLTMLLFIQDEKLDWKRTYEEGLKLAQEKNLYAVVHFTGQG